MRRSELARQLETVALSDTTITEVARRLGISRSRLSHKMNDEQKGGPVAAMILKLIDGSAGRGIVTALQAAHEWSTIVQADTETLLKRLNALIHQEAVAEAKENEATAAVRGEPATRAGRDHVRAAHARCRSAACAGGGPLSTKEEAITEVRALGWEYLYRRERQHWRERYMELRDALEDIMGSGPLTRPAAIGRARRKLERYSFTIEFTPDADMSGPKLLELEEALLDTVWSHMGDGGVGVAIHPSYSEEAVLMRRLMDEEKP
jgi:transcriptional regulator with XRE-family HTH domain